QKKNDGETGEKNIERDFIRSLLSFSAFYQFDHAVHERFARVGGNFDFDFAGEYACASRNSGTVATGFTDHGGGIAGDGGFIYRCDAFDDFTVGWNQVSRRSEH